MHRKLTRRRKLYLSCLIAAVVLQVLRKLLSWSHKRSVLSWTRSFEAPSLSIHVLTCCRPLSLERLLDSLAGAQYGASNDIDLNIHIDWSFDRQIALQVRRLVQEFDWPHGNMRVHKRLRNAGLAISWIELNYDVSRHYLMVLEDDIQVSPYYYDFLRVIHGLGYLQSSSRTALCLHPNDWQISVKTSCRLEMGSKILYDTPEPCNWAPVWKTRSWVEYVDWVHEMTAEGKKPYVPDINNISYNYNSYIDSNVDVQSPWVWRYNWEHSKLQVRYSFIRCGLEVAERYFAINHKEPGSHFKRKIDLENDPSLLKSTHLQFFGPLYKHHRSTVGWLHPAQFGKDMLMKRVQG